MARPITFFNQDTGHKATIDFPDGTSDEQVHAYFNNRMGQSNTAPEQPQPSRVPMILNAVGDVADSLGNTANTIALTNQAQKSTLPTMKGAYGLTPQQTGMILGQQQRANEFSNTMAAKSLDDIKREHEMEKHSQAQFKLEDTRFNHQLTLAKQEDDLRTKLKDAELKQNTEQFNLMTERLKDIQRIKNEAKGGKFGWVQNPDGTQTYQELTPGMTQAAKPEKAEKPQYVPVWENGKQVYRPVREGLVSEPKPAAPTKPQRTVQNGVIYEYGAPGEPPKPIYTIPKTIQQYLGANARTTDWKVAKGLLEEGVRKGVVDVNDANAYLATAFPNEVMTKDNWFFNEYGPPQITGGGEGGSKRKKYNPNTDAFE